jgi:hypothetical protein
MTNKYLKQFKLLDLHKFTQSSVQITLPVALGRKKKFIHLQHLRFNYSYRRIPQTINLWDTEHMVLSFISLNSVTNQQMYFNYMFVF